MSQISPDGYDWIRENAFGPAGDASAPDRLGRIAVARRFLTETQLDDGLREQRRLQDVGQPELLGQILVRMGVLSPPQVLELLEAQDHGLANCSKCDRMVDAPSIDTPALCPACGGAPSTGQERRFGKYVVRRVVAEGGMGVVFEAEDPTLKRRVALKVLKDGESDAKVVTRLHREAEIAAQLRHPNIVGIHEVGMVRDDSGLPRHFIAMDYIDGQTMYDLLREGKTERKELLRMLEEVARAAAFAHSKGIVHRDLKPSNVLIENGGRVLLTDFGIARAEQSTKLTKTNSVLGTPQYMAPEQVEGKTRDLGPRTDVYALGAMLYEILTGRPPFLGPTPMRIYEQILRDEPQRPRHRRADIERDIEAICLKAIEKKPELRYGTATDFAEDLRRFREGAPIRATRVSTVRRLVRRAFKYRAYLALGATMFLLLAAAGVWTLIARAKHRRQLAAEQDLHRRREEGLRRLSIGWSKILERKRELRQRRIAPDRARRELSSAVSEIDEYIREWPDEPQGYYVRAKGMFYLGNLDQCERDARASVARRPDFRPGWSLLSLVEFDKVQQRFYGPSSDIEDLRSDVETGLTAAMEARARGVEEGHEKVQVESWGLEWTREDQVMDRIVRADSFLLLDKKPEEAWRLIREAREEYAAEEFANWMGNASSKAESVRYQTEAISLAPGYVKAYVDRGKAQKLLGKYPEALADYDQAIQLDDGLAVAYYNRGSVKNALKDYAGAIRDFDRTIDLRPYDAGAYNNRGNARNGLGDWDGALRDFGRAIALNERYARAFANRGDTWMLKKEYDRAIADYDRAIDLGNATVGNFDNRGIAKASSGDVPGAIVDFTRAIELKRDYFRPYANRGQARLSQSDFAGAEADLREALRLAPADWPLRKKAEDLLREAQAKRPQK